MPGCRPSRSRKRAGPFSSVRPAMPRGMRCGRCAERGGRRQSRRRPRKRPGALLPRLPQVPVRLGQWHSAPRAPCRVRRQSARCRGALCLPRRRRSRSVRQNQRRSVRKSQQRSVRQNQRRSHPPSRARSDRTNQLRSERRNRRCSERRNRRRSSRRAPPHPPRRRSRRRKRPPRLLQSSRREQRRPANAPPRHRNAVRRPNRRHSLGPRAWMPRRRIASPRCRCGARQRLRNGGCAGRCSACWAVGRALGPGNQRRLRLAARLPGSARERRPRQGAQPAARPLLRRRRVRRSAMTGQRSRARTKPQAQRSPGRQVLLRALQRGVPARCWRRLGKPASSPKRGARRDLGPASMPGNRQRTGSRRKPGA